MSIILNQSFDIITCYKCGIAFGVPSHWMSKRLEDQQSFWCPNGHEQSYTVSTADKLRAQLEKCTRELQQSQNREAAAADALRKSEAAKKRLSKRLSSGVCPVAGCKRHFTNLQRHITTEHAGLALPEAGEVKLLQ